MKRPLLLGLFLIGSAALAAEDEAALKAQMLLDCATLFAPAAPCADLAKGTRNCVRQNLATANDECVEFEKAHQAFFDAGKNDPIIKK
jgi:hypothetical protein